MQYVPLPIYLRYGLIPQSFENRLRTSPQLHLCKYKTAIFFVDKLSLQLESFFLPIRDSQEIDPCCVVDINL